MIAFVLTLAALALLACFYFGLFRQFKMAAVGIVVAAFVFALLAWIVWVGCFWSSIETSDQVSFTVSYGTVLVIIASICLAFASATVFLYKPEEVATYGYYPDFAYISTQLDGWTKRWEAEIVPLIRKG